MSMIWEVYQVELVIQTICLSLVVCEWANLSARTRQVYTCVPPNDVFGFGGNHYKSVAHPVLPPTICLK